jgi:hypothetical protein
VDAWIRSWRARREGTIAALNDRSAPVSDVTPVVSLAVTALILQWATIYYFNVVHKNGPSWRDGTAVYYFFQQDRMVTLFGAWVRDVLPLGGIKLLTWSALAIEAVVALLLLSPIKSGTARLVAWVLISVLHLSIDAVVQLGPFSWAMVIMFAVLVPSQSWRWLRAALERRASRRVVYLDSENGFALSIGRIIKRLDVLGLVKFEPAPEPPASGAAEVSERAGFAVSDRPDGQVWTGTEALVRLFDALVLPCALVAWMRLPGLRGFFERRLERVFARRERLARFFGVGALPGSDDMAASKSGFRETLGLGAKWVGQACVLLLMIATASQVLLENRAVPKWMKPEKRPEWMTAMVVYPRLFQGWSMFAPSPPMDDGRLVVDGRTVDGRRFDPLTGGEPSFEVQPKDGFRMNQIWGDFHRRIAEPRFRTYHQGVREFLLKHHELTGRPQDRLIAFDLWFVNERIPPPGEPKAPPTRNKVLSHGRVD